MKKELRNYFEKHFFCRSVGTGYVSQSFCAKEFIWLINKRTDFNAIVWLQTR